MCHSRNDFTSVSVSFTISPRLFRDLVLIHFIRKKLNRSSRRHNDQVLQFFLFFFSGASCVWCTQIFEVNVFVKKICRSHVTKFLRDVGWTVCEECVIATMVDRGEIGDTVLEKVCVFYCHSNLVWTNLVGHAT